MQFKSEFPPGFGLSACGLQGTPTFSQTNFPIIIYSLELFTSALADGFSLESEWQQVSSSLQDSS